MLSINWLNTTRLSVHVHPKVVLSIEHVRRIAFELKLHFGLSELFQLVFKLAILSHHMRHDILLKLLLVLGAVLVGFVEVVVGSLEVFQFLSSCASCS